MTMVDDGCVYVVCITGSGEGRDSSHSGGDVALGGMRRFVWAASVAPLPAYLTRSPVVIRTSPTENPIRFFLIPAP